MTYDTNYLSHHGILGMHWGVRRFQNKDGSLTAAGKKRYEEHPDSSSIKDNRKASELSNQELKDRLTRLNMEKQYNIMMQEKSKSKKAIKAISTTYKYLVKTPISVYNDAKTLHSDFMSAKQIIDEIFPE